MSELAAPDPSGDVSGVVTPVDPAGLFRSPAFAQGMIAPAGPTLYVGGQNGVDAEGELLEGLGAQTEQALRNLLAVLAEVGAGPEHVAKLTIYLDPSVDPTEAYAATGAVWSGRRTAVTVLAVAPARAGALVEIEAVAAVPGDRAELAAGTGQSAVAAGAGSSGESE